MRKNFFSLQYKFFIYFLVLSIIPTVITGVFSYYQSSKIILKKTEEINAQKLNSLTSNICSTMSYTNEISHLIFQNNDVREYFYGNSSKEPSEIMNFLTPFVGYSNNLFSIRIEGVNGERLITGNVRDSYSLTPKRRQKADSLKGYYFWYPNKLSNSDGSGSFTRTLSFTRQYRDMYKPSSLLGYITIDIMEQSITDTYRNQLSSKGSVFLIADANGKIITSSDEKYRNAYINLEKLKRHDLDKIGQYSLTEKYVINTQPLKEAGWTIIDLTPISETLADNQVISSIILSMVMCCTLLCILLAFIISKVHLEPLRTLGSLIKNTEWENFNEYSASTSNDEVGLLAREFNKMSRRLKYMMEQVYTAQLKQSEAEFNALQAQINPHFLYNTLDTIYWVCRLEHSDGAAELVKALGNMFRLSLNKGEGLISLSDELKHLNSYLTIQKKRCKDNVKVEINVDPNSELENAKVIKLVLQPLVENAFVHGISNAKKDNIIKIAVKLEKNNVIYKIEDNGAGINPEFLAELNSNTQKKGFGIRNVNERIKLLFGEEYGITISSVLNQSTVILVKQPFIPGSSEKGEL